jgi:hypothetical protein
MKYALPLLLLLSLACSAQKPYAPDAPESLFYYSNVPDSAGIVSQPKWTESKDWTDTAYRKPWMHYTGSEVIEPHDPLKWLKIFLALYLVVTIGLLIAVAVAIMQVNKTLEKISRSISSLDQRATRLNLCMANLVIYTIYDHPKDYPDHFVIKRWRVGTKGVFQDPHFKFLGKTLADCRKKLAKKGLARTISNFDDPVIIESYI